LPIFFFHSAAGGAENDPVTVRTDSARARRAPWWREDRSFLLSKAQTGRGMYRLVEKFHGDLGPLARLPLPQFFHLVRKIPYQRDKQGQETIARPAMLLGPAAEFPALDCKKKGILIASWLRANGIPYRLMACGQFPAKKFHHVFPQGAIGGRWRNLDATYPHYRMFQKKARISRAEVLKP
jgi:hypothetical protein